MASKSRVANTAMNTAAGITAKMINIITGFVMRTVFIHTLGIAYTGVSSLFTEILTMLSFVELGIASAITYALYKPISQGDHERMAMLVNFYKKAYRIVALVVLVAGLSLVPVLHVFVPAEKIGGDADTQQQILDQLTLIYVLYVINSAVSYLLIYKTTLLTAHQEQRYVSVVQICISIARLGIECAILYGFKGYEYCFIIYLVAGIILTRLQNGICSYIADRRYPEIKKYGNIQLPKDERKKLFKNISALMVYKICNAVNSTIDSIIISSFFGSLWVGFVSNYRLVTSKVNGVINQFYGSMGPSIGNLAVESDEDKQFNTFHTTFFLSFWMMCVCATSFIVLLNPFVNIWLGETYVKNIMLPISLTVNVYLGCMVSPISSFRSNNGLFVQGWYRPLVMLITNLILSFGLAWWIGNAYGALWGIVGVKLATAISQIATIQWFDPWLVYRKVFKRPLRGYFEKLIKYTAVTVLSVASTYLIGSLFTGWIVNKYVSFIILVVLCMLIPNGLVVLFFRKNKDFAICAKIFGRAFKKIKGKLFKKISTVKDF